MKRDKQSGHSEDLAAFGRIGLGALLPGMIRVKEMLENEIERMQTLIREADALLELAAVTETPEKRKVGRPLGSENKQKMAKARPVEERTDGMYLKQEALDELGIGRATFDRLRKNLHIRATEEHVGNGHPARYKAKDIERMRRKIAKEGNPAERQKRRKRSGWNGMTAEERSIEMLRRQEVRRANEQAKEQAA